MFNPMLPIQEMTVIPLPVDKAYSAALAAAESCGKIKSADEALHRIVYTTGASFASWGELLTIQLIDYMNSTQLLISSQLKTSIGSGAMSTKMFAEKNNKKEIDRFIGQSPE